MAGRVLDLRELLGDTQDNLATAISRKFIEWEIYRSTWMVQKQELRNYLFAVDTSTTSNKSLPWKNSTTTPKLTQLRDNLHANYMAALFPNDQWLQWEGNTSDAQMEAKRKAIEGYMRTKFRQDNMETVIGQLVLDWIDYGNCFGTAEWVDESITYPGPNGLTVRGYVGPRPVRIAPQDITFNPTASNFINSPKIIRAVTTLGELRKKAQNMPPNSVERKQLEIALGNSINIRQQVAAMSQGDTFKAEGFIMDGFGSIQLYYQSDYVELLTFYGDLYDVNTNRLLENHVITIMDRNYLVESKPNPNWTTHPGIFHAGWRQRPDNLYAMGPLDNLVGMQYRIDHLENLKADVFDMIGYPMLKLKGYVEDFDYAPGNRILCGDDGDAEFLHPEAVALQADNEIAILTQRMEELAGAPKEAAGFRSPGEKTKFEVQLLDNAANRIFMNKITHLERNFIEPLLNFMLQLSRRKMTAADIARTLDSDIDAVIFTTISQDDIVADGNLRPQGAENFAQKANALQTLVAIGNSHWGQDPAVNVHLSGKAIAKLIEYSADLKPFQIFSENIRVIELGETQKLQQQIQEQTQVQGVTPAGITEGDPGSPPMAPPGAAGA